MDLVVASYRATATFPATESYGLVSQIRRAAVSIPANLAEGNGRGSAPAFVNHVGIALGSHGELRALIEVSARLGLLSGDALASITAQIDLVGRLLAGFRRALKTRLDREPGTRACS
jgi:four helix bundle protein